MVPGNQPDTVGSAAVEVVPSVIERPSAQLLHLPELRFLERKRIGIRFCLLAPACDHAAEQIFPFHISSRRDVPAIT